MSEDNGTRLSVHENTDKTSEKAGRRRSLFKNPNVSPQKNVEIVERMSELNCAGRYIHENIDKIEKKPVRRRSLFENPDEITPSKDTGNMSALDCTRRSINENIDKVEKKAQRRLSVFENPNVKTQGETVTAADLKKWDKKWGKYNLDYVHVIKYPEDYVQKIMDEREAWFKGMKDIKKRLDEITEDGDQLYHITEAILTPEQKDSLSVTDSKINEFIKTSTTFLKEFEVYKRMQEVQLEKIERKRKLIEMMAVANK